MKPLFIDTNIIAEICRQNDVASLSLFGSVGRGEATENSDVDLLVQFLKRKSLLSMVKLERQLAEAIGQKVDLVTEASLSPYLRERVKSDVKMIYAAR
jgi:predicted nucleotidyltransferase